MYGIIYVTIKDYAEAAFSSETWKLAVEASGITVNLNSSEQPYSEENIYALGKAIASVSNTPEADVLYGMGYQIAQTTFQKYPEITVSRGDSIKEYFLNLPAYHNRNSLIYPNLKAPEFRVASVSENDMVMQYLYKLAHIAPYVHGYYTGIAHHFDQNAVVEPLESTVPSRYMAFKISW